MSSDLHILGKANSLAQRLHVELGFPDSKENEFHSTSDEYKKQCWDMAVIAYKELLNVDPNDSIPKGKAKYLTASDIRKRINAASSDGKRTRY